MRFLLTFSLIVFGSISLVAQTAVRGTVYSKNNEPLAAVQIFEMGTTNATTTDLCGNFELNLVNTKSILQISWGIHQKWDINIEKIIGYLDNKINLKLSTIRKNPENKECKNLDRTRKLVKLK